LKQHTSPGWQGPLLHVTVGVTPLPVLVVEVVVDVVALVVLLVVLDVVELVVEPVVLALVEPVALVVPLCVVPVALLVAPPAPPLPLGPPKSASAPSTPPHAAAITPAETKPTTAITKRFIETDLSVRDYSGRAQIPRKRQVKA
jgi:hypothetical protein